MLNASLQQTDPEVFDIIECEKERQRTTLCLIASEVDTFAQKFSVQQTTIHLELYVKVRHGRSRLSHVEQIL